MNTYEKVSKLLASFSFKNATSVAVEIISVLNDGTVISNNVSTHEYPSLRNWDETKWQHVIARLTSANQALGFKPKQIKALSVSFTYDSWEAYHIENTNIDKQDGFNRFILPAIDIRCGKGNNELILMTPLRELFLRKEEQKLLRSVESVVLCSKIVDPQRLREVDSSLPLALLDDDASAAIRALS